MLVFGRLGWTVFLLRQNLVCPGFEGELQLLSDLDLFAAEAVVGALVISCLQRDGLLFWREV